MRSLRRSEKPEELDRYQSAPQKIFMWGKKSYTYKKQEMKDKFETYSKLGYKPKLLLGNQFVTV